MGEGGGEGGGGGSGLQSLKVGIYQLQSKEAHCSHNLEHNDARSANAQSAHKGVNYHPKDVTQAQQRRPESPTVTPTWHASKYKVPKLHQIYKEHSSQCLALLSSSCIPQSTQHHTMVRSKTCEERGET